jgi:hypothetical protein
MESVASAPVKGVVPARTGEEANEGPQLGKAFPREARDLDELFPDPEIRRLLCEVAGDLAAVEKFVGRMDTELKAERASIKAVKPGLKKVSFK